MHRSGGAAMAENFSFSYWLKRQRKAPKCCKLDWD
jgi:hypothetical protein